MDLAGQQPYFSMPLLNIVDAIAVTSEENPAFGLDVRHDTTMFDGVGRDLAFYKSAGNRANLAFTPGLSWTFVVIDRGDLAKYRFQGIKWINVARITDAQPIQ